MSQLITSTTPDREFKDHEGTITAFAIFPNRQCMVTGSKDKTLRLWDLKTGVVLKKMEGHRDVVYALAVSPDGKMIASGSCGGEVIAWHGETGESLAQLEASKTHSEQATWLEFSPDGTVLVSSASYSSTTLWSTTTWQPQGDPIDIDIMLDVFCVRYSPSGELLATAGFNDIVIYNSSTRERVTNFKMGSQSNPCFAFLHNGSLAWTPDGTRLLSASDDHNSIMEWDASTWKQVGNPWTGHTSKITNIVINPAGTLVASAASADMQVRLWLLSDRRTIAILQHESCFVQCLAFSMYGKRIMILSRSLGHGTMISEWAVPKDIDLEILNISTTARWACTTGDLSTAEQLLTQQINADADDDISYANRSFVMARKHQWDQALQDAIKSLCIQLSLTGYISKGIALSGKGHVQDSVEAFDLAFTFANEDSRIIHFLHLIKVMTIFNADEHEEAPIRIRERAAACPNADTLAYLVVEAFMYVRLGNKAMDDARHNEAADHFTAAVNTSASSSITAIHYIYEDLVVLFGWDMKSLWMAASQKRCHALLLAGRLRESAESHRYVMDTSNETMKASCLEWSTAFKQECRTLCVTNGDAARTASDCDTAIDLYLVAIGLDSASDTIFANRGKVKLEKTLWKEALLNAQKVIELNDTSDKPTKVGCLDWLTTFKQECRTICATNGDAALAESDYDRAIDLYSTVIDMDPTSDGLFSNRSKAKLGKMLWKEALLDAQKVIELNPSSYLGYDLKHAALHGAKRYDEAIQAFQIMLSKLSNAHDTQTLKLRQQYIRPCEAERAIREVIDAQLDAAPLRVLNTATGLLCDRGALISDFTTSTEYKELWSSTTTHADLSTKRIKEVVATYFSYAMLSHRWGGKEPLLQDIQRKAVYDLEPVDGITKLQSFCGIARSAGYRWAWSDTCCIDQNNNVELQRSVNSMFLWYRHSSLTVVYLSDVAPSSQSGALANSVSNTRGWTFQEFLASKVILFYQKDWMLYLDDRSHNHKECAAIMQELQDATGIDRQTLVAFRPGMSGARDRLQWASTRITTLPEDVAYSLFGIFGVHLPVIYGEKKENALGRLLQEVVGRSGDITILDWVGQSSEFNSCLPADITSYAAPPHTLPSLSEDEIQTAVSSLRHTMPVDMASKFYDRLEQLSPPRFTNCRLRLPCITFHVTEVRRRHGPAQGTPFTYGVKANGLRDLLITTEETLVQFSRAKPTRQTFLLVRPWNHCLLELPDFSESVPAFGDDAESIGDWSEPESLSDDSDESPGGSPGEEELDDSDSYSRALRLIVRLGQPFGAFLLAQQRGREYKRIASDQDIIAQAKDVASVHSMMDVRTLEVL